MGLMVLFGGREHEDVVQVHRQKGVQPLLESGIHQSLKSGRGVTQPKRKNRPLKQPIPRQKCGFVDVWLVDGYLMVARAEVYLREEPRTCQTIQQVVYSR